MQSPGLSNTRELRIEWGHCDPAGIVFHPRYFEFFDWSCVLLIEKAAGVSEVELRQSMDYRGIPIVSMRSEFKAPLKYGAHVLIETSVEHVGRSSLDVTHRITANGVQAVDCQQRRVWCGTHPKDPAALAAQPIPLHLASRLKGV